MKKFILIALFAISLTAINAQTISFNAYYSTNSTHLIGGDLLLSKPNGLTFGIGGSHATKTIYTNKDYDINLRYLWNLIGQPNVYKHYVAERGTLTGLFGYTFNKKTILLAETGISFRQEIVEGTTSLNEDIPGDLTYQSRTVKPGFVYGASINQYIKGRWGLMLGYNNITNLKFGIVYKITPTNMFNY